jgi:hypothetical protein
MNYLRPTQIKDTGKWHFVQHNKRSGSRAVGYCRDHEGHDTEAEAVECYRKYQLNERLRFGKMENQKHKCEKCGEWTQKFAIIGNLSSFFLCEEHCNKETVDGLFKGSSEIWSS